MGAKSVQQRYLGSSAAPTAYLIQEQESSAVSIARPVELLHGKRPPVDGRTNNPRAKLRNVIE